MDPKHPGGPVTRSLRNAGYRAQAGVAVTAHRKIFVVREAVQALDQRIRHARVERAFSRDVTIERVREFFGRAWDEPMRDDEAWTAAGRSR